MESASVVLASEKGRRSDSIFAWKTWENHGRKSPGFPKDFTAVGVHPNKGKPETDLFQLSEKHAGRKWKHKNIGRKLKFLGPTKNENQEFFLTKREGKPILTSNLQISKKISTMLNVCVQHSSGLALA
jgi:hypothetical protein